jgi:two-component system, chemotaxis family, chemotaxis protein CheY
MEKINIIVIEDQREVLQAISKDLTVLESAFLVEECESTAEARQVMEEIDRKGDYVALIISDQVMPNQTGVEFLIEIHNDPRFTGTRKILLTGLATHHDTIEAINKASIDRYIAKPWKTDELLDSAKSLLTKYILEKGIEYQRYIDLLDSKVLFEKLRKTTE